MQDDSRSDSDGIVLQKQSYEVSYQIDVVNQEDPLSTSLYRNSGERGNEAGNPAK